MRGLLITGTDTDVGKTYATAAIVRAGRAAGLRVGAYKPVCTGCETDAAGNAIWPDVAALDAALDQSAPPKRICPQRFAAPLAPPSAAQQEGQSVNRDRLFEGVDAWRDHCDLLIVEGVGGLLCPLTETETVADFARALRFPLVIVTALRLGAINHTLLTMEVAQQRHLPIAGVLLNQISPDEAAVASTIAEITARITAPILGILPFQEQIELRLGRVISTIDWWNLASSPGIPLTIAPPVTSPGGNDNEGSDVG